MIGAPGQGRWEEEQERLRDGDRERHDYWMALTDFTYESLKIEGIHRNATAQEVSALEQFLACPEIRIKDLYAYVKVMQPNARLRDQVGLNVRVGSYIAPPGSAFLRTRLRELLKADLDPYERHCRYESLHPFTDGNGRSGRALWLHDMARAGHEQIALIRGFLHEFYYQSLTHYRKDR